jgi:NADPH:quinone reductase-like Zn-dependent oxidoreductase
MSEQTTHPTADDVPAAMKAVRLHEDRGAAGLRIDTVPVPTPAADEVLVRVEAAAITRDELTWPTDRLPAIPSYEVAGTVVTAPEGSGLAPGDRVFGMTAFDRDGVAAEYAAVPADRLAALPDGVDVAEAAALALPGLTAYQSLVTHGHLEKGQRALVTGAGGGVGAVAVQVARELGAAHVVGVASPERADRVRALGVDEVVTPDDLPALAPVDVVLDTVGGDRLAAAIRTVREGGRAVSVNEEPPADLVAAQGIEGIYFVVEPDAEQLAQLATWAADGSVRVEVASRVPLPDAVSAFESLEGAGRGKTVLVP